MNREEIIRMAREAGFGPAVAWKECTPPFERFAALVAAAEREACAKVCDEVIRDLYIVDGDASEEVHRCAFTIRARSNT